MQEQQEMKMKNAFMAFIRENFEVEGQHDLVEEKILDLTCDLYELVMQLTKK